MNALIWIGIAFCVSQSAMFSGLNLAFFSISKLRLEIEINSSNKHAIKISTLRKDVNFLLTTILLGNVGINVLLTLLSSSVLAGILAFIFSTFVITFLGEIIPQAYFSRHAMRAASLLSPILRIYQFILYPVAKPAAMILDLWLGREAIRFFEEKDLRELLELHVSSPESDINHFEGKGALNFLAIDDLTIAEEGESIDPKSIVEMDFAKGKPFFPPISHSCDDPFLKKIQESEKKWVILTDSKGEPQYALNSDSFLRSALFDKASFNPIEFCHRPIIIRGASTPLGEVVVRLTVHPEHSEDDVIDKDLILLWDGTQRRIITGSDVLGRLLRGVIQEEKTIYRKISHSEA